jgi:TrmH family RNA methyltransferase
MKYIESKSNPIIKNALKLCKAPKDVIIIEGERLLLEAIEAEHEPELIFTSCKSAPKKLNNYQSLAYQIPQKIINEMKELNNNVEIISFVKPKIMPPLESKLKSERVILILDRLQDPGNIGTIVRTAEAMGVSTIILLEDSCQKFNRKLIRAAMGSFFRVDIYHKMAFNAVYEQCKGQNFKFLSTNMEGRELFNFNFPEKCAIVLGQEGQGVAENIINKSDNIVSIPMKGHLESLNVAASAAMCLYEWAKQDSIRAKH